MHGIKRTRRLKRSTIVKIQSKPRTETGKFVTKSIVTCSKGLLGFSTGTNKPGVRVVLPLLAEQTGHLRTNYSTEPYIFYQ
jgi:hypothetical protein